MKTNLVIRPAARGGKYLGPDAADGSHHSALVALLDPFTGECLAAGLTDASNPLSAGPPNLMDPVSRSAPFATDADTVQIQLSVDISEPTLLTLAVVGPWQHLDQARLVESGITVLPGVDIGTNASYPEGLVIEIPGLCISNVAADWTGPTVTCSAKTTMMCGCPIRQGATNPGWPWPDTDFSIQLVTCMQSGNVYYYPFSFDTTPGLISSFKGQWPNQSAQGDRVVQAWVSASEPKLGNQGFYRIDTTMSPPLSSRVQALLTKTGYATT